MLKSTVVLTAAAVIWRLGRDVLRQRSAGLPDRARESLFTVWNCVSVVIVIAAGVAVWDLEDQSLRALRQVLALGFDAGDRRITVLRLIVAGVAIVIAWLMGRMLGVVLDRRVFPHSQLDVGMRTAIVTSLHYVLMATGLLVAVRIVGFDLTNLAILAGALGVGVGFGLQTLVSNFVSGLIILYERPFRLGDILEQDGVMGTVRKIRTRSTLVQTFDESDLVVPNAELLTRKIVNWTLTNYRSRAIIPVGVSYGSDVVKVRDTLYQVAKAHPRLLDEPRVYFATFGQSALEFRLMVCVDIRERGQVLSDLHFAIEAAFRELGIFPQRDAHASARPGE